MNTKGVFSRKSDLWKTPSALYKQFMNDGYFDPCPSNPQFDGLSIEWHKWNFVNPPYSEIIKWLEKGFAERERTFFGFSTSSKDRHKMVCKSSSRKMPNYVYSRKIKI